MAVIVSSCIGNKSKFVCIYFLVFNGLKGSILRNTLILECRKVLYYMKFNPYGHFIYAQILFIESNLLVKA